MRWMETWLMFSTLTTWIFYSLWLPCQLRCPWWDLCLASLPPQVVTMPTWSWEGVISLPLSWHRSPRTAQSRVSQRKFNRSRFRRRQRPLRFSEMKMTLTVSRNFWFPPKRNEDPRAKKSNLMVRYIKFTQHRIQKTNSSLMRRRQTNKKKWLIRSTLSMKIWVH